MAHGLRRFLQRGPASAASIEDAEHALTRNTTLLMSALGASGSGIALLLWGLRLQATLALVSGLVLALALGLSMRGHHRTGVLGALLVSNVTITTSVTAEGADSLAVVHLFAVCAPFSLYSANEKRVLLLGVAMGVAGVLISAIPLVPSPWAPSGASGAGHVRAVASLAMTGILAGQLWLFVQARERTLRHLSRALDAAKEANRSKASSSPT